MFKKEKQQEIYVVCCTCFKAFLLCFCEGEMSLLVGTDGDEHRGCGDDGCDCSLEGTMKYRSTKHVTKYISWGRCADFITLCFCFGETETNSVDKEADYITLLKYHIVKNELNFRTIPLLLSAFCFLQNIFLHSAAVPSQCCLICIWLCSPLHRLFQK